MIDDDAARGILAGLVDFAVRSGLLIILTAAALRLFRAGNPIARLHAWRLVLIACLVLPILSPIAPRTVNVSAARVGDLAHVVMQLPIAGSPVSSPQISFPRDYVPVTTPRPSPTVTFEVSSASVLLGLYATGVAILVVRAVVGWWMCGRLRRMAEPITAPFVEAGTVFESAAVRVPMTVGIIRPVILLPVDWHAWPSSTLQAVLVHESAHIRRRDHLTLALAVFYRTMVWVSPAAWWLRAEVSRRAEDASDATVLATGAEPHAYARTIVSFASRVDNTRRAAWSLAVTGPARSLNRRVEQILRWKNGSTPHMATSHLAAITVGLALVTVGLASVDASGERTASQVAPLPGSFWVQAVPRPERATRAANPRSARETTTLPTQPRQSANTMSNSQPAALFSGHWIPVDPDRAKALFDVGLSDVAWLGMDVVHDSTSLVINRLIPPEVERAVAFMSNLERRSVYSLDGTETRSGPSGDVVSTVAWEGRALVIYTTTPNGTRRSVWTTSEDRLRIDTSISMNSGVANTVVLILRKEQPSGAKAFGTLFSAPVKTAGHAMPESTDREVVCGLTLQHVTPEMDQRIIVGSDRLPQRLVTPQAVVPAIRRVEPDVCTAAR